MKTIKYRQYYYDGDYSEKELNLPDSCVLCEVYMISISHKVKDKDEDIWTKSYILIGNEEFEDSEPIGDIYFDDLSDIFITDTNVPILDIESVPKFKNIYFVEYYTDHKAQEEFNEFYRELNKTLTFNYSEEELKKLQELSKKTKGIASISKLRRFTPEGIEYSLVSFKSIFGGEKDIFNISIHNIKYNNIYSMEFTSDENIAKLFKDRANEIYNNIINE